jgi:hypothetical protein
MATIFGAAGPLQQPGASEPTIWRRVVMPFALERRKAVRRSGRVAIGPPAGGTCHRAFHRTGASVTSSTAGSLSASLAPDASNADIQTEPPRSSALI